MKITEIHKRQKSLSFEIFPPKKDAELDNIDDTLDVLCELDPDYISVTFGAGGSVNGNRTVEIAKRIKNKYGIEPVVHLTCLHYSTVLLIDSWTDKKAIDIHHATPMMKTITELREKYDLHMAVERYVSDETDASGDDRFIRK